MKINIIYCHTSYVKKNDYFIVWILATSENAIKLKIVTLYVLITLLVLFAMLGFEDMITKKFLFWRMIAGK